ncbi:MAG: hypothetical protein NDI61_13405 [Bdellovibrionaceae bacterium]|nr:hypothetical protein [Pseudobdellovibrionaceae bacterium]
MSMLMRYKKTGGFQQLLNLIETCSPTKREQLMKVIQAEDPSWAALLKTKMLTLEKFFAWDPIHIAEVTNEMPTRILAAALAGLPTEMVERATLTMPHMKKREIESLLTELKPSPGETETARMKVLTRVREMEKDKRLDLSVIDPSLSIRDLKVA